MTDREIIKTELRRLKTELIEEGENTMFEQGRISAFEDMEVFIDSLQVEPVSEELDDEVDKWLNNGLPNKEELIEHIKETARHFANWQKEKDNQSVSEELEEAAKNHAAERFRVTRDRELAEKCKWSFITGAKWGKNQAMAEIQAQSMALAHECPKEPVSEDLQLEKAAKDYSWIISKQVELVEKVMGNGAKIEKEDITNAFITGAKWQRQQLIKDAIKTDVKADKDGLYTDESWDEMNELLQKIGAKAGDKVYICIIRQEEE